MTGNRQVGQVDGSAIGPLLARRIRSAEDHPSKRLAAGDNSTPTSRLVPTPGLCEADGRSRLGPSPVRRPAGGQLEPDDSPAAAPLPAASGGQAAGRTQGDECSTQRRMSSRNTRPTRPVRGKPTVHTDRPGGRTPSAICPWTPRHSGLQRYTVTHDGTEKKRPASTRISS